MLWRVLAALVRASVAILTWLWNALVSVIKAFLRLESTYQVIVLSIMAILGIFWWGSVQHAHYVECLASQTRVAYVAEVQATELAMPTRTATPFLTATLTPVRSATPMPSTAAPTATLVPTLGPTATRVPSRTPVPASTTVPTPVPTGPVSVSGDVLGNLPGLRPADVSGNLEGKGCTCSSADFGVSYYSWTCERDAVIAKYQVDYYASSLTTVDLLESTVLQFVDVPDDDLAAAFLGFMATMPYDGADPQAARAWVESTLPTITEAGDVRTATFGSVTYQLYGPPAARTLEMGSLD